MQYSVHDYIIHAGSGICQIDGICSMKAPGAGEKDYYKLVPVYESGTIYTPFDRASAVIRRAATKDEILAMLDSAAGIEPKDIPNDREREDLYKSLMKENTPAAWLTMIRTASRHNRRRTDTGKKPAQLDERYLTAAENLLGGEAALALGIERERVREYIAGYIDARRAEE